MTPPRQAFPADGAQSRQSRAGGSARLEVTLGLVILILAVWLAADLWGRFRQHQRCDRLVAELRQFAAAFRSYARQHQGGFPASARDGAVPAGMEALLKDTAWSAGSPFGGNYGWVAPDAEGANGAIILTAFIPSFPLDLSRRDLRHVDAMIDDGNLATGRFRTGFNGWPVYLVGEGR